MSIKDIREVGAPEHLNRKGRARRPSWMSSTPTALCPLGWSGAQELPGWGLSLLCHPLQHLQPVICRSLQRPTGCQTPY